MSVQGLPTVQVEEKRTKIHDFNLDVQKQVQRKIEHANNAVLKVEINNEEIKLKPNSGNFKVLSEEVLKLKVGDVIGSNDALAQVKDQHQQTDLRGIPYMMKTEFIVTDVATGFNQKAVLHTYLTQTFFMVQGKGAMHDRSFCKDFFYNSILKQFMGDIMKKKGKEICFINKILKSQTKAVNPSQWKRKQLLKLEKCDICSRTFSNQQGVNLHKKRIHGHTLTLKNKTLQAKEPKVQSDLKRSESVGEGSRSSSPSPKKLHAEEKVVKNENKEAKKEEKMEHSGGPTERVGDKKEDIGIQCKINSNVDQNLSDLEQDLFLARQEIVDLKKEQKLLKSHNARKHAGYESELEEVVIEKQRFSVELLKVQEERDILLAKVESLEKKNEDVDECIKDAICQGNCEHVGCSLTQLKNLRVMKQNGGRRTSPSQEGVQVVRIPCPQCNFTASQKSEVDNHVRKEHGNHPSCPFCLIGFFNQGALRKHIEESHKENTQVIREFKCPQCNLKVNQQKDLDTHVINEHGNHPSCPFCLISFHNQEALKRHIDNCHHEHTQIVRDVGRSARRQPITKGPCIFYLQPRGCKKGNNCDFSHEQGANYTSIKVPKLCHNGTRCNWKPRCRYIHPEDGEIIPPRSRREGRPSWEEGRVSLEEGRAPREVEGRQQEQVFVVLDSTQPPPGYTMNNYPTLVHPVRKSIFRMNPQSIALSQ